MSTLRDQHESASFAKADIEASGPAFDSGLRCPSCGYNLTGLTAQRCPECGEVFSPEQLRWDLENRATAVPGWDDGALAMPIAFAYICLMTWFRPLQFARTFPPVHRPAPASTFKRTAAALVAVGVAVLVATHARDAGAAVVYWVLSMAPVLAGAMLCERAVTHLFDTGVYGQGIEAAWQRKGYGSFGGMVGYYRSFLPLNVFVFGSALLLGSRGWQVPHPFIVSLGMSLWWLVNLTLCMSVFCRRGKGAVYAMISFFILGVVSTVVLVAVVGIVTAMIVTEVLELAR